MEITTENFTAVLPEVDDAISRAEFLAIDTEFTGLTSHSSFANNSLDTPEVRYDKIRQGSSSFLVLQFGLCTFEWDEENKKYVTRAFNFYTFPRQTKRNSPDIRFLCQASSIDFLVAQGMDFNKVFKKGISYVSVHHEQALRDAVIQKYNNLDVLAAPGSLDLQSPPIAKVPKNQEQFVTKIMEQLEAFVTSEETSLNLEPCSGFQRKLIYENIKGKYPESPFDLKTMNVDGNSYQRYVQVSKVGSQEEKKKLTEQRRQQELNEVEESVGFAKVIRAISNSKKPIVGHNMLLDLILTVNTYIAPLPESYSDFKLLMQTSFPRVIDTKLMATTIPFKDHIQDSALGQLYDGLRQLPKFTMPGFCSPEGFPAYADSPDKLHEAGYDAFITGACFATMKNFLGKCCGDPFLEHTPADCRLMEPFTNRIFLMRVFDIPYLNLAGPDEVPDRRHVFHIQFPTAWKADQIQQIFEAYGGVFITWLGDTSAYVTLKSRDETEKVMLKYFGEDSTSSHDFRLLTFEEFQLLNTSRSGITSKQKVPKADVDLPPKRRRSRSKSQEGNRSISTIMEDQEEEVGNGDNRPAKKVSPGKRPHKRDSLHTLAEEDENVEEDIGEPVIKKMKATEAGGKKKSGEHEDKLFDEPAW